jgi:hypothetical protein
VFAQALSDNSYYHHTFRNQHDLQIVMESIETKRKERKVALRTFWSECISVFFLTVEARDQRCNRQEPGERRRR